MGRVTIASEAEMLGLGRRLANELERSDVVALHGDLGAGKTTLARGILAGLGHEDAVPSPTFTLVQTYDAPPLRLPAWHADLYRLNRPEEALELGLEEGYGHALILIEWPERLGDWLPPKRVEVRISGDDTREVKVQDLTGKGRFGEFGAA